MTFMKVCTYVQFQHYPRKMTTGPIFRSRLDSGFGEGWLRSSSGTSGSPLPRRVALIANESWWCHACTPDTSLTTTD